LMAAIQVQLYEVVTERNHVVISEASHSEVVMIAGAEMRDLHSAEMMGRVVTSEMTVLVEAEMIAGAEMRGLKVEMVTERIAAVVVEVTEEDRIETERKEAVDGAAEEVVVPMIATGGLEELTLAGTRVELAEVKILADVEEKGTTSGAEMITVIVIEIIVIMVIEGGTFALRSRDGPQWACSPSSSGRSKRSARCACSCSASTTLAKRPW